MENLNPFDVLDTAVLTTAHDALEQDECNQKALKLAEDVYALHAFVADCPRWDALFDQAHRASSSAALNFAQGIGKLKGHCGSDWLVSRGELYELYAAFSIGPQPFRDLKPQAKELIGLLDVRLRTLPEKPPEQNWKQYGR